MSYSGWLLKWNSVYHGSEPVLFTKKVVSTFAEVIHELGQAAASESS